MCIIDWSDVRTDWGSQADMMSETLSRDWANSATDNITSSSSSLLHSNLQFKLIQFDSLNKSIHIPKKTGPFDLESARKVCHLWLYSLCWHHRLAFISIMHHYECVAPNVDIILQSGWFWATPIASFSERFSDSRSCWVVFIHIVRGRPGGLLQFSKGEAVKICLASDSSDIHAVWPNRERCRAWTVAERCGINELTTTLCCHRIHDIVPSQLLLFNSWNFYYQRY